MSANRKGRGEVISNAAHPRTVSVVGLGLMGAALARALLAEGHAVTVWNRTPSKSVPLAAKGALVAPSALEAVLASDATLVCVTGHEATMDALDGVSPAVAGRLLVQLSTTTPDDSLELAHWAESRGIRYLEGSILGLPSTVDASGATVLLSGPRDLFEAHEPLFRALGTPKHLSPKLGTAVAFDRILYAFGYGVQLACMQGAAMTHALGFPLDVYYDTMQARAPAIIDQCLARGEKIAARSYGTSDGRIKLWAAAFEATLSICRERGVDDALPTLVLDQLRRASAAGYGDSDLAAVFEILIPAER